MDLAALSVDDDFVLLDDRMFGARATWIMFCLTGIDRLANGAVCSGEHEGKEETTDGIAKRCWNHVVKEAWKGCRRALNYTPGYHERRCDRVLQAKRDEAGDWKEHCKELRAPGIGAHEGDNGSAHEGVAVDGTGEHLHERQGGLRCSHRGGRWRGWHASNGCKADNHHAADDVPEKAGGPNLCQTAKIRFLLKDSCWDQRSHTSEERRASHENQHKAHRQANGAKEEALQPRVGGGELRHVATDCEAEQGTGADKAAYTCQMEPQQLSCGA